VSFTVDFGRLRAGEWIALAGGVALFGSLFIDWYGGGAHAFGEFADGDSIGLDGWDVLTDLPGFIVILTGLIGIKFAALAALGLRFNWALRRGMLTLAMGWLASAIVLWRIATGYGGYSGLDPKVGIFIGLASTLAIAIGAWLALRDDGFSVLVPVGGRRRG
jgi:hypothetical protein